ncbi:MAG: Crp/Fnr family transcriptional regulator [Microcoleaceae cyanobacterium]
MISGFSVPDFLANTTMFQGLNSEYLVALANIAIAQNYQKGETIFLQGEPGRGFFMIVTGRVKVFKVSSEGKEQILHIFQDGEHFAELPAFDGQCFPASAVALEKSFLLFFPRQTFLGLLAEQPNLAINLLKVFARYLRKFAQLIEDLSLKEVPGRLAAYLLDVSQSSDHRGKTVSEIHLNITKTQLAALLGTIPETLSRVFSKMSQDGLIDIDGNVIKILNPAGLRVLAGDRLTN